jgi:tetratricopeptide (TPR) repeat protein
VLALDDDDDFLDDLSLDTDIGSDVDVDGVDDDEPSIGGDEQGAGGLMLDDDEAGLADEPAARVAKSARAAAPVEASQVSRSEPKAIEDDQSVAAAAKQQLLDQLEEADFYMQQGLHEEAEPIYRRVLEAAPNHARALTRLAEIAAARAVQPQESALVDLGETPVPDSDLGEEEALAEPGGVADDPDEVEIHVDFSDDEIGGEPEPVASGADTDDFASLDLDDADTGSAESDGSDTEEFVRPAIEPPAAPRVAAPLASAGEGDFDLAAALADAFDGDTGPSARSPLPGGDDGFAEVFQAFKKGVRETLSEGDHQAHYDLAIAYKGMGLFDDAIYELRTAMADPNRTAECLHLIGLCAIDSDQAPLAIEHLEQLLLLPNLGADAALAGRFDLGRALEAVGDIEGARREWQAVSAQKPGFQDVGARLAGLGAPKPDDSGAGGFESFEDVTANDAEGEAEEVAVGGETFDDLVAEANTRESEPQPALEAEPVVEDSAPPPPPGPAPAPPRRKKKISFL